MKMDHREQEHQPLRVIRSLFTRLKMSNFTWLALSRHTDTGDIQLRVKMMRRMM